VTPASRRSIARRGLPEPLYLRAQALRLRARHLPMRVLPEGRAARARIAALRDAHRGETCVILGNGPSLRGLDLAQLDGTPTFCLNRGYLLWQDCGREPSFFVAVNELVIDQFHREIAALSCSLFLPWIYRDRFRGVPNAVFFEVRNEQRFITDARRGVAPCATVTVAALQLAYHMGFETVILLGVDHRFETTGPPHATVLQEGDDPNHFRGDYFGNGTAWNLPDLRQSERGYARARAAFEADGRQVFNATPDSALDVFKRRELDVVTSHV
jgi:hypothetical protein